MAKDKLADPVTTYARRVVEGDILAGKLVIQACQRHLDDLKRARAKSWTWDTEAAQHAIDFFQFLKHWKGEWAGKTIVLEAWQQFVIGSLFGWKLKDKTRRFRYAYIEVARKNGKTLTLGGIGLYLMIADGEPGAEVYSAATIRDQAKIVWEDARRMVKASPFLSKLIKAYKNNLSSEQAGAKFEPLGADDDSMDGLNPHGVIIDELHAHKGRGTFDVLRSALGARRQPLMVAISTAGFNQDGIGYEQREYAGKIMAGLHQDEGHFAYLATIDEGDDPFDDSCWMKANPNLGVSVKLAYLRGEAAVAKELPAALNNFLCKHLNVWTQQSERWVSLELWDENGAQTAPTEDELAGRTCYGGLDLSSVSDLTACVWWFPSDDDPEAGYPLVRAWCPESRLHDPSNQYRSLYQAWKKQGYLQTTPGDAIDYGFVREQILRDATKFQVVDMNLDRLFQAHQLAGELTDEGLTVIGMGQGFMSMSPPSKEFERRLLGRKIRHAANPVLRWAVGNVTIKRDPAGNIKPDKSAMKLKIDPLVALVMALDRAMRHQTSSVYEQRGIISF